MFVAFAAISFASCGNENKAGEAATDSLSDSTEVVAEDSLAGDSVEAPAVEAPADSAAQDSAKAE